MALLTVVQRETQENGDLYACFVDIRKAFPRVRREILYKKWLVSVSRQFTSSVSLHYTLISRGQYVVPLASVLLFISLKERVKVAF